MRDPVKREAFQQDLWACHVPVGLHIDEHLDFVNIYLLNLRGVCSLPITTYLVNHGFLVKLGVLLSSSPLPGGKSPLFQVVSVSGFLKPLFVRGVCSRLALIV